MPKMKKLFSLKLVLVPIFIFSLITFGSKYVQAAPADEITICNPFESSYEISLLKFKINIAGTTDALINSAAQIMYQKEFGVTTSEAMDCDAYISSLMGGAKLGFNESEVCGASPSEATIAKCNAVIGQTGGSPIVYNGGNRPLDLMAIDSSLSGIANKLNQSVYQDPILLNLAYFWNDQTARIPFVGKALAAPTGTNSLAVINAALDIWKLVRNIAIGFMAIILLYTGLLIILRKKISAQLVVTVQYAIPKIIIGLVLILFSYPIGAAITAISWGAYRGANTIILNYAFPPGGAIPHPTNLWSLAPLALSIAGLKMGFVAGVGILFLVIVVTVVSILMLIIVQIKAYLIYLKMVLSTVIAPFDFAVGTVPGSEGRLTDWFKRMAKYGLSIFAMGAIMPITLVIAFQVLIYYGSVCSAAGGACSLETAGLGTIMMVLAPLIIIALGYSMAFSMEKTIDKWFFGSKER